MHWCDVHYDVFGEGEARCEFRCQRGWSGLPNDCSYHGGKFADGHQLHCNFGAGHGDGPVVHEWGMRVNGSAKCRYVGCEATDYDSQWGAGLFSDWPRGHHKPYGS